MRNLLPLMFVALAGAAQAAGDAKADASWFTETNIVFASVLVFVILVFWFAGSSITGMLDERGNKVREQLDEAKALREEAQSILGGMKAKQQAAAEEAGKIVTQAKADALAARDKAMADLDASISRRKASASEKIRQAQLSAIDEVKAKAIAIAGQAASTVLGSHMSGSKGSAYMDESIAGLGAKLN